MGVTPGHTVNVYMGRFYIFNTIHCLNMFSPNSSTTTATAKSLQSCPTLCDPIDCSPPSSPVPGVLQARTLEWVAISFSNAWKWKVKVKLLSHVRPSVTPWTATFQAPPSMGFSRQEYWSGVPLPSPWLQSRVQLSKRLKTKKCSLNWGKSFFFLSGYF